MDDKILKLARKMKEIESELSKITQIKDLEGLLFVNTEITNKYKKSINDVVNTYKDYVSKTQKELNESMDTLKKESREKTVKDKKYINDLDNKINKIKEDIKNICVSIDKSIEDIQKDILKDIKKNNNEILSNLSLKDKEISKIKKENAILNDNLINLKDMLNKLELQKGDNGKSAYEIACELGFNGSKEEWIKSLHGKDGKDIELRGMRAFSDAPKDNKIYGRQNKKWVEVLSDYSDLPNKPKINNVELSGNKVGSDLGLQNVIDNTLNTINKTIPNAINEVNSIAKGANQALSYGNYSTMITAFNNLANDVYNVGQNIMIVTLEVPDLWISSVEQSSSTYTYVDDETIVNALETDGYIQVGYYKLSALETQKVDLTNYITKDTIITLSQAQYEALTTKDPDTYYYIIEE